MKVFLNQDFVRNKYIGFDNYTFLTYVGLRILQKKEKMLYVVSLNQLTYELFGKSEISRSTKEKIRECIEQLDKAEIITIVEKMGKQNNKWKLNLNNISLDTSEAKEKQKYFVCIELEDIQNILTMDFTDSKNISILRYYAVLLSSMRRGVGHQSLRTLRKLSYDISETTQLEYLRVLEEYEILYVYRFNSYKQDEDGKLRSITNYYGRFTDKDKVEKEVKKKFYTTKKHEVIIARPTANKMRSIKQKLNSNIPLTAEEVMTVRDEDYHKDEIARHYTKQEDQKSMIKKKYNLDYNNAELYAPDEQIVFYKMLKDRMQQEGERMIHNGDKEMLITIVEGIIGKDKLATNLTVNHLNELNAILNGILIHNEKYNSVVEK